MNPAAFLLYIAGNRDRFHVLNKTVGNTVARIDAPDPATDAVADVCFDLDDLNLADGGYSFAVKYIDPYGASSAEAPIAFDVSGGEPDLPLRGILAASAKPLSSGNIKINWTTAFASTLLTNPTSFDVLVDGSVVVNIPFTGAEAYEATIGPYANGLTIEPFIMPKTATVNGTSVSAGAVSADSAGPAAPDIVT